MKSAIIAVSFILISFIGKCQKRGDNQILVHNTTLKIALNTFMDAGYSIDKYDTTLGTVSKVTRKATNSSLSVIWRVRLKDSTAIITGEWMSLVSMNIGGAKIEPSYYPLDYRTSTMNQTHDIFLKMADLAKKMGDSINFAKVEP